VSSRTGRTGLSRTESIAAAFVQARRAARALPGFPADAIPETLAEGYACQEAAIRLWPEPVAGWKVGFIGADRRDASGEDRVVGPIFAGAVWPDRPGAQVEFPVFVGGFAAVEAEYVFRLGADAPPGRVDWTPEDAAALVGSLHIGVETAGSPLATINRLGPTVVAADFGNNAGLILGREIPDWRGQSGDAVHCETWIEGHCVGRGGVAGIPGGLLGALAFALGRCARRGLPMRAGMLVTTGAATGIHDIAAGQHASVRFGPWGEIRCRAVAAQAREGAE
jgi:2-keto-4-pentenoate hydratase